MEQEALLSAKEWFQIGVDVGFENFCQSVVVYPFYKSE